MKRDKLKQFVTTGKMYEKRDRRQQLEEIIDSHHGTERCQHTNWHMLLEILNGLMLVDKALDDDKSITQLEAVSWNHGCIQLQVPLEALVGTQKYVAYCFVHDVSLLHPGTAAGHINGWLKWTEINTLGPYLDGLSASFQSYVSMLQTLCISASGVSQWPNV